MSDARELLEQFMATGTVGREKAHTLADALRAVLDEHYVSHSKWCRADGWRYPCPTVQAITRELTGDSDV